MPLVDSSNIAEVEWNEVEGFEFKGGLGNLDTRFHTGDWYRYFDVPKGIYEKLIAAKSKGQFHNQFIVKAGYRYEKLEKKEEGKPFEEFADVISYLESKGLARKENDESGDTRVIFFGEWSKEMESFFKRRQK